MTMYSEITAEIDTEMVRQTVEEGYTPEHDDAHPAGELARAGAAYAIASMEHPGWLRAELWPWKDADFKPKATRRNLVVAAALIGREIARYDRVNA